MTRQAPKRVDLTGVRVLIAEDEAMIAMDLEMTIEEHGGTVVGPFPQLGSVLEAVAGKDYDVAILDIMLGREEVYPAAEVLVARKIGFIFHSGHGGELDLQARFPGVPICSKPATKHSLLTLLTKARGVAHQA